MINLNELNKEQKEAVLSDAKHLRIIAGAGSGKTRVLISRIVHLINERHIKPYRICAITFTNKAALEMSERLEIMEPSASAVNTSTIHSLCVRIIREEHDHLGLIRYFNIIDTTDQKAIIREAYKVLNIDKKEVSHNHVLSYISEEKFAGVSVEQAKILAQGDLVDTLCALVYEFYVNRCKELQALDFDDLLLEVNRLFKNNQAVAKKWQARFDVILVDEFQDVDAVQYGIIQSLTGLDNDLYVVGDPDQTIYTWRGANVSFITDFDEVYKDAVTITLNQNYRSSQHILNAANALINYNKQRPKKDLFANKTSDEPVVIQSFDSQEDESFWIVSEIIRRKESGYNYLDMAVLYRSNYLSRSLERVLMQRQIPYVVYGGMRFYDHAEIKDMLAYLKMVTQGDDLSLRRSIGSRPQGIGPKSLDNYFVQAQREGTSMFEAMRKNVDDGTASSPVSRYVNVIENLRNIRYHTDMPGLIQIIMDKAGFMKHYTDKDELERIENLMELQTDARFFENSHEEGRLEEYIQMVSLYGERGQVVTEDHIRLMSVHASKGLEFENVFIAGVNEQVFPNKRAMTSGILGLEEERRLMYVAITRAKEHLAITYNKDYSYITGAGLRPSRFISEIQVKDDVMDFDIFKEDIVESEAFYSEETVQSPGRYAPTDVVVHDFFGEGVVISVAKDTLTIAFSYPHNLKTIAKHFKGLRKKEALS